MIIVLYVDDEELLLELAKEYLEESQEMVIETATSARAGLERIKKGGIDVIVSDYMMPGMDGLEFLSELRGSGDDIPFILFTGKGREEVVIEALNSGADSYLQKGGSPRPQFAELAHRIKLASERRQALHSLKQSEARLMRAEEIAGFGHWELHLDNKAIYVSPGAKKIYGTDRTQEPYDEVKKIPLPEYRELLDKEMADLIETGRPYDIEYRARHPSGGQIVYVHSRAEYDPVRRIVFGVIQDITERKMAEAEILSKNEELASSYAQMSAAEEELRAAQHRLAVTMDLAKLVYWELDTVKNIFIFNDRFYAIYGTTAEREGGNFMTPEAYTEKFVYPDDRERVAVVIERNLSSTIGINTLEHKIVRRDGQVRDIVVCIEVERDLEGRPVRIYGANQDITERKQAEVALERANRKLGLLNSITRHDITNQLTVLRGNLELLKISVNDREIMARLDKVERSSQIILDQIRFTKEYQDMGSTAPQWQRVRGIVPSLPQLKEIKHLRLSEGAEKLSIYADPMLPKVFSNLIENTLRYGSKPATVRIECEPSDHGMKLIYEDDGPGIPIDDKQNIFRKGFGKGTGLGLFLSQEILAITGITIEETGIPGHGARFELSIPSNLVRAL